MTQNGPVASTPLFLKNDGRIDWVDVAKGFCIFFVVMMHSTLGVEELAGATSWMGDIVAWAQPARMPAFFLVAGLFLMKSIDAPWRRYVDRKVVHFAYFYLLWMVIQCVVKCGLLTGQPQDILPNMITGLIEPYGTLWFIYILPIFFLATRAVRNLPVWLVLAVAALMEMAPVTTGLVLVDEFASRFVYFFAGYALAPYVFRLAEEARSAPMTAVLFLAGWAVINTFAVSTEVTVLDRTAPLAFLPLVSLVLGAMGAMAVVTISALISHSIVASPIRYMGARSIVIYLAFFLPMAIAREGAYRLGLIPDVGLLSVVTTLAAVVGPLIGLWIIEKIGFGRFLFERPDWAKIDRSGGSGDRQRAALTPAE